MITKGEGGEDTASVLLPLPRRLAWTGSGTVTGLLWIGQDRSVSTSTDRNASAYYHNLLPTTTSHIRENDYQKATVVYAIRGFSTIPGLGDSQRSIIGRSIHTLCPEATWISVRVSTTTGDTGWVYEELMVVLTVRTRDRVRLAGYLREATGYLTARDTIEWYGLMYERGATVQSFLGEGTAVHTQIPSRYLITGIYNLYNTTTQSDVLAALHEDNRDLTRDAVAGIYISQPCNKVQSGRKVIDMFIVWARAALLDGCTPILTSTIGGLRGLAAPHESVHIAVVTDGYIPGCTKCRSLMISMPRLDPYSQNRQRHETVQILSDRNTGSPLANLRITGPDGSNQLALVVPGNTVATVTDSDEKAKSEANNNSIWKSICEGCSDSLKQQAIINRLQQQVEILEQENLDVNQQGNERLAEMETSISKVVVALNKTQLDLGTRAQVVYEPVMYTPTTARSINRPRPNSSSHSTNTSNAPPGRPPIPTHQHGGTAGRTKDYRQQAGRSQPSNRGRGADYT